MGSPRFFATDAFPVVSRVCVRPRKDLTGSPKAAGGIGGGGHGGGAAKAVGAVRGVGRELCRRGIGQADAGVHLQVVLAARGAVAFARVFIAQAGQFVAPANAIAVAGFRSGLNRHKGHGVRFAIAYS